MEQFEVTGYSSQEDYSNGKGNRIDEGFLFYYEALSTAHRASKYFPIVELKSEDHSTHQIFRNHVNI